MLRIHALLHVPFEGLGHIAHWIASRGHQLTTTRFFEAHSLPNPDQFDRLIIMGGPMNIYQDRKYPWLASERGFIREVIRCGKSVVGICLGAQLVADALGSPVYAGKEKEIGWFPIALSDEGCKSDLLCGTPPEPTVFHWHGDTFDLPAGAVHLAASQGCTNQAFLANNRILGLQFHLESTPETVRQILAHCSDELVPGPYIQSAAQIEAASPAMYTQINALLETVLDRLP